MIIGILALIAASIVLIVALATFVFRDRWTQNAAAAGVIPTNSGNASVTLIVIVQLVLACLLAYWGIGQLQGRVLPEGLAALAVLVRQVPIWVYAAGGAAIVGTVIVSVISLGRLLQHPENERPAWTRERTNRVVRRILAIAFASVAGAVLLVCSALTMG